MKSLTLFLPYVMPYVMGCPKPTARQAVLAAAIEFCEQSMLIQQTLDPIDTEAGEPEYELSAPRGQAVIMPMRAWFKSQLMDPVASDQIRNVQAFNSSVPDRTNEAGDPREFFFLAPGTFGVYPLPSTAETGVITVRAALKPTRSATQVEDVLLENWVETIACGALYRLHSTAGQAYTDLNEAVRREQRFRAGINRATIEASKGRVRGDLRVTLRGF